MANSESPLLGRNSSLVPVHGIASSPAGSSRGCRRVPPPPPADSPPPLPPRTPRTRRVTIKDPSDSGEGSHGCRDGVTDVVSSPRIPSRGARDSSSRQCPSVEYSPSRFPDHDDQLRITFACRSCGGVMERRPPPVVRITDQLPLSLSTHPPPPPPQPPGPHHLPLDNPLRTHRHETTLHTLPQRPAVQSRASPSRTPRDIASLSRIPESERPRNEYVDSPTLQAVRQNIENSQKQARQAAAVHHHALTSSRNVVTQPPAPVTTQPTTTTLKKTSSGSGQAQEEPCRDSVMCPQCNKCRCQQCAQPRELPGRFFCKRATEICTCLCCVQFVFYHCCRDNDTEDFSSDDPCACCQRAHCCERWACMAAASLCFPCLLLYPLLQCCLWGCTECYNGCSRRGCHCRRDNLPGSKRLLIDSESSST